MALLVMSSSALNWAVAALRDSSMLGDVVLPQLTVDLVNGEGIKPEVDGDSS
jgi:hypothetical protein